MRIPVDPDSSFTVYTPIFWAFSLLVMGAAYVASLV